VVYSHKNETIDVITSKKKPLWVNECCERYCTRGVAECLSPHHTNRSMLEASIPTSRHSYHSHSDYITDYVLNIRQVRQCTCNVTMWRGNVTCHANTSNSSPFGLNRSILWRFHAAVNTPYLGLQVKCHDISVPFELNLNLLDIFPVTLGHNISQKSAQSEQRDS
jgi:hypothetical protein